MSALFHLYLCGRNAAEWLIYMKQNQDTHYMVAQYLHAFGLRLVESYTTEFQVGPNTLTVSLAIRSQQHDPIFESIPTMELDPSLRAIYYSPADYIHFDCAYLCLVAATPCGNAMHMIPVEDAAFYYFPAESAHYGRINEVMPMRDRMVVKWERMLVDCLEQNPETGELITRDNQGDCFAAYQQKIVKYTTEKKAAAHNCSNPQKITEQLCIQLPQESRNACLCTYFSAYVTPTKLNSTAAWNIKICSSRMQLSGSRVIGDPRHSAEGYYATIRMSAENYFRVMANINEIAEDWMNGTIPRALDIAPLDYSHFLNEIIKEDSHDYLL